MTVTFAEYTWTATHTSGDTMTGFFYGVGAPIYDGYSNGQTYFGGSGWTFTITGQVQRQGDSAYWGTNYVQSYTDAQSGQTVTPYYWDTASADGTFFPNETDSGAGANMLEVINDGIVFNGTWYGFGTTTGAIDLPGGGGGGVTSGTIGTNFNDTLTGSSGNDVLYGYGGNDNMFGGLGDDIFLGGDGADFMDGQGGNDIISYYDAPAGVAAFLLNSLATFSTGYAAGDTSTNINNLYGSVYADSLGGNDLANTLAGFDGDDFLLGYGGNDYLAGGVGNDSLYGMNGTDYYDGGEGFDRVSFAAQSGTQGVTVYMYLTTGQILDNGFGAAESMQSVESIQGSSLNDLLIGDNLANVLDGSLGHDAIAGLGGNDYILGADGNDYLAGGDGNDTIVAGLGNDTLLGEEGFDNFLFTAADFANGQWDFINGFSESATSWDWITFSGMTAGNVQIGESGGTVYITVDTAGFAGGIAIQNFSVAQLADQITYG